MKIYGYARVSTQKQNIERMSRNAEEGFAIYERLYSENIELEFLKEPQINTRTYKNALESSVPMTGTAVDYILEGVNRYLLELAKEQIRLAFEQAEKEVEDLHQRTREGIERKVSAQKRLSRHILRISAVHLPIPSASNFRKCRAIAFTSITPN